MNTSKLDHALATLEGAADHAHLTPFERSEVTQDLKTEIASALNQCIESASDLERFLGHAAAATLRRDQHHALYDAARKVGDMPDALRDALRSVDAFTEIGGTAIGAIDRAALELKVALRGHSDDMILAAVDEAFVRALGGYDQALDRIAKTRSGFIDVVLEQRKALAHLQREIVPVA